MIYVCLRDNALQMDANPSVLAKHRSAAVRVRIVAIDDTMKQIKPHKRNKAPVKHVQTERRVKSHTREDIKKHVSHLNPLCPTVYGCHLPAISTWST